MRNVRTFDPSATMNKIPIPHTEASQSRPGHSAYDPTSLRGCLGLWLAGLAAERRNRQNPPRAVLGRMVFLDARQPASHLGLTTQGLGCERNMVLFNR